MENVLKADAAVEKYLAQENTPADLAKNDPKTLNYRSWNSEAWFWTAPRRPIFSWITADLMVLDPRVKFGLAIGNAPLLSAQISVDGPRGDVNDFVQEQWDRIWGNHAGELLLDKNYGHMPFEVSYRSINRRLEFDTLRAVHPRDARPLLLNGRLRGIRISGLRSRSQKALKTKDQILRGMEGLWLTYDERFNNLFGRPVLLGAYAPWYEKATEGGALDLRVLRMQKDAWIGDVLYAPLDQVIKTPSGEEISAGALARQLHTLRKSGGALVIPSNTNGDGKKLFEYQPPTSVQGATPILEWCDRLDYEIFDGLLVPREVVEAAETGSGFSGRSIPFLAFLSIRDVEFSCRLRQINEQILQKLVALDFGQQAAQEYETHPVPLIKTVGKLMGDMGQPNTSQGGQPGGMLSQLLQRGQQPGKQTEGEKEDDGYQFATVDDPPSRRDKPIARRATQAGATLAEEVRGRLDELLKKKG